MGLLGSLELQLGMLLCLWMGILVEKELLFTLSGSCGADIIIQGLVVVV